jgi:beta-galactosidase
MQREDLSLIKEMGANTIRLAHYQHDQLFLDLCDEAGMIVWAEIPCISEFLPSACENSEQQMKELIAQNINHPSIVCWGLSNEITSSGEVTEGLLDHHRRLNALCHEMDPSRPTVTANVFMLPVNSPLLDIPDLISYNLYFGWYLGSFEDNGKWLESFWKSQPGKAVGISEYGADANVAFQGGDPKRGDYSEAYQALLHEKMLELRFANPSIWATHAWNMFDFAADGRNEGGKKGVNQKGLVTFDRKIKKDAYFVYKAYLSKEPFVHICGSRYIDRAEDITIVKVCSNQEKVELYLDGALIQESRGHRVYEFSVPIAGEHLIEARSGNLSDRIAIRKAEKPNPAYRLANSSITNWFDVEQRDGYFSLKDKLIDLKKSPKASLVLQSLMAEASKSFGDVAKNVEMPESFQRMLDESTLEELLGRVSLSKETAERLAKALAGIRKGE